MFPSIVYCALVSLSLHIAVNGAPVSYYSTSTGSNTFSVIHGRDGAGQAVLKSKAKSGQRHMVQVKSGKMNDFLAALKKKDPKLKYDAVTLIDLVGGRFDAPTLAWLKIQPTVQSVVETTPAKLAASKTQSDAPWNLARLASNGPVPPSQVFGNFVYDSSAGSCADIYIVDSGINIHHDEFENGASHGKTVGLRVQGDQLGHGTHVAAVAAGRVHGVAKRAKVYDVKVTNNGEDFDDFDIILGLHWIYGKAKATTRPAVVNMSLGMQASNQLDRMVELLIREKVHVVVAAGNHGADASHISPARVRAAITVGNIDRYDKRNPTSNYGPLVDIYAPGTDIFSAALGENNAIGSDTGTSFAAPMVTGLVAYLACIEGNALPAQMKAKILSYGQRDVVKDLPHNVRNNNVLARMPTTFRMDVDP